jgi:hypothetical protein
MVAKPERFDTWSASTTPFVTYAEARETICLSGIAPYLPPCNHPQLFPAEFDFGGDLSDIGS